jgi:hypothetical protein
MFPRPSVLATLLLALQAHPLAASYHFAQDGDDSRSDLQARSSATPWRSFSKLSSITLQPGDSVLLKRGHVWRDSLRLTRSGTAQSPVVIAPWGEGSELPEIRGTDSLVGAEVGLLHQVRIPQGRVVRSVFVGRARLPVSRFPDTGWIVASSVEGDSAVSAGGLSGKDWKHASVHLRTSMWTLETHRVAGSDGGRISLDRKAIYGPPDSVRFYLTNHPHAASSSPSWHQSFQDSTLRWTGPSPAVEASVRSVGIDLANASHVVVRGLRIFGTGLNGLRSNGTGIQVRECQFLSPGLVGIAFNGREGAFVANRIEDANNGALVGYGNNHLLRANQVRATALAENLGPDGMGPGCCGGRAIEHTGDSGTIAGNDIDSSGYIGIGFRGRWTLVEENQVARSCMTTDDCGGIYTWTGKFDAVGSEGSVIRRNIVSDPVGAPSGWPHPWDAAQGIYLDDGTHDVRVDSNVSSGAAAGLFLHNTRRVVARGNILFGNRTQVRLAHDDLAGPGDMVDNVLEGNLLVGLRGQGTGFDIGIHQAQTAPLGRWSSNILCSDQILSSTCRGDSGILWRRERIPADDPRLGPQTQRNASFDSARIAWSAWPAQNRLSIDSTAACGGGKCLRASYVGDTASRNPLANSGGLVSTAQGQAWRLSFRARGQRKGQILTPVFRRSAGDYANLGFSPATTLDSAWTRHDFLFRSKESEPAARMDFHSSRTDSVYWLDDVSLRAVPESLASLPPAAKLLVNTSSVLLPLDPGPGPWMDPWGIRASTSVSLAPWSGIVLFSYEGVSSATRYAHSSRPVLVLRGRGSWGITGLDQPATVHDTRGRLVGTLLPDPSGTTWWLGASPRSPAWVRTGTTTLRLPPIR